MWQYTKPNKHTASFTILLIWCALTLININKAYHIDDTFHLEAAQLIQAHPLSPMSGKINWSNVPSAMYEHNQPPLFFYAIALWQNLFGNSEISLHLLLSIFTLLSLIYFSKLTRLLNVQHKTTLLLLFGFCPAFIVNQNLMTDIPVLFISLAVLYYLLKAQKSRQTRYFLWASVLLSAGLLIKYSLLPLAIVVLFAIIISGRIRNVWTFIIPVLVLSLWSVWNYAEYGGVHILSRKITKIDFNKPLAFFGTAGSVCLFSILYISSLFPRRFINKLLWIFIIGSTAILPFLYFEFIPLQPINRLLIYTFIVNGMLIAISVVITSIKLITSEKSKILTSPFLILGMYIYGVSLFMALFAPFNATRHILLIIPVILLFTHSSFEKANIWKRRAIVVYSIFFGLALGISDWMYANAYRTSAKTIEKKEATYWTVGYWGWQWYAEKAGMRSYNMELDTAVKVGDYMIIPQDIEKQYISSNLKLDTIDVQTINGNVLTFFSVSNHASFYNSYAGTPSWLFSKAPLDRIYITRISEVKP